MNATEVRPEPAGAVTPSRTAAWSLAARAIGSRHPDPTRRNPDGLAAEFLGVDERRSIRGTALARATRLPFDRAVANADVRDAVAYHAERTRFIDRALAAAIAEGTRQVVILGSGFDSRAQRFAGLLRGCRVIEVDRAETQAHKRRRVSELFGTVAPPVTYAAADLTRDALGHVLDRHGYDAHAPALFICEGLTMYLPEAAVHGILASVTRGKAIVFDHWSAARVAGRGGADPRARRRYAMVSRWGEPVTFGLPDGHERAYLRRFGLTIRRRRRLGVRAAAAGAGREWNGAWVTFAEAR